MEGTGGVVRLQVRMRQAMFAVLTLVAGAAAGAEITIESVVKEMNLRRAAAGLPPLREDVRLREAAEDRMRDMEELGYWGHVAPDGRSPFLWLRPRGYEYSYAAENLASGFETAEVLMDAWMESKGHRDNIMWPLYKHCGIAVIEGATTGKASGRSVVVFFGRLQNVEETQTAGR